MEKLGSEVCNLCGDAVPQVDLVSGQAYRRGPRLICAACDRAMGGGKALAGATEGRAAGSGTYAGASAQSAGGPTQKVRARGPHPAVAATGFLAAGAIGLAAWGLWQARDSQKRVEHLESQLEVWDAKKATQWSRFQSAQEASQDQRFGALDRSMKSLEERGRDAWATPVSELGERITALGKAREEDGASSEDKVRALTLQLEAWQTEFQRLSEAVAGLEEEQVLQRQAVFEDMAIQSQRLDQLEVALAPVPETPTGIQAAPWFSITADLENEAPAIRLDAVYSLEQSHDIRICAYLLPMLKDSDALIRVACARILAEHRFRPAAPDLIAGLGDPMLSVRDGFIKALRRITGRQFGFRPDARETERKRPVENWREWWASRGEKFLLGEPA